MIQDRCASCHDKPARLLPRSLADERGVSFWQPSLDDPRLLTSRHIVFNLSQPEKSLMLLAPLAKEAGGWGLCKAPAERGSVPPALLARDTGVLPPAHRAHPGPLPVEGRGAIVNEDMERELYTRAIHLAHGNQAKAARWLGVTRTTMRQKLTHFGLHHDENAAGESR